MKLFSRLGRVGTQVEVAAPDTESTDSILSAALAGGDEELRVAAVGKLPDGDTVRGLAGLSGAAVTTRAAATTGVAQVPIAVERAAQVRLASLIDSGHVEFAELRAGAQSPVAILSVASLCADPDLLAQAFEPIKDPLQVAQLVLESPFSRVRQLAAESVEDPALLRELIKQVRSHDKNVYKILKHKCDVLNASDREAARIAGELETLCASLERHAVRPFDTLYIALFEPFDRKWRSLEMHAETSIGSRCAEAYARCREIIGTQQQLIEKHATLRAAEKAAAGAVQRARQAAAVVAAAKAEAGAFAEAQKQRNATATLAAQEAARAEQHDAREHALRQIGSLIRKAEGALRDGNTKVAAGLRRAIEEKCTSVSPPPHLTRQLHDLDQKLNELKEWKDFAVAPKRVELIAEMEGLIGSSDEPQILAERIKSLQEDWRTISKGIVAEVAADWERFHKASQAAYDPCRKYFEEQAKRRQTNLESRRALVDRLVAFEKAQEGENPDWRLVARALREAPQEWRRHFPVEREPGRAVQADFDASLGRLQTKLDGWYERNVAEKQALIQRARHCLEQWDGREAMDGVKRLQALWKETGPAPKTQDQSLWREFRELCELVYQKRQQAHADHVAGIETIKNKAVELCEEVERVAGLSGAALIEGLAKLPELGAAFDALGEMPAQARGTKDRFERGLDLCKSQMASQKARDAQQSVANLFEAARHIRAYEWAAIQGASAADIDVLRLRAEAFIAGDNHWPKGGLLVLREILTGALAAGGDARSDVAEANEKALRLLCIRAEIHSESLTPDEDAALRREFQVQRLVHAMGQGRAAEDQDAMLIEWLRVGAIAPAVYETLEQRFVRCRAKRAVEAIQDVPRREGPRREAPRREGPRREAPGKDRRGRGI